MTPTRQEHEQGFSLIEMLTVLAIMGMLFGLSLGVFRRSIPRRELARNEITDKLRRARMFAVSQQSPASVTLRKAIDDEPGPVVSSVGRRLVGVWHLEGNDLFGWPHPVTAQDIEETRGALGKAVHLSGDVPSYLDFGLASSFESVWGLAAELFVRIDDVRQRTLLHKGDVFRMHAEQDGHVRVQIRVQAVSKDDPEQMVDAFHELTSDVPVLFPGRFVKLGVTFDGISFQVSADDYVVAEQFMRGWTRLSLDREAPLLCGDYQAAFGGSIDEVKWGVYATQSSEPMLGMKLLGNEQTVRFVAGGGLDPLYHAGPVDLGLATDSGAELWVSVGVLGDVN